MRIALISRWLALESERFGSEGGFVQQLAESLIDRGHEVVALSQRKGTHRGDCISVGRIATHLFDAERRLPVCAPGDKIGKWMFGHRKIITDAIEIRHFLKSAGPFDAVWAQAEDPDGTSCGLAARLGKIPPLVIMVHAVRWREDMKGKLCFIHRNQLSVGFSKASVVAVNSTLSARWLSQAYGVSEAKLGLYRVNLTRAFLARAAEARKSVPEVKPGPPRILFFGAMNPTKAPDIFLQAARVLAPRHPGWEFVLAGGETEKNRAFTDRLQALLTHPDLKGRVRVTGALDTEEVVGEISRASLVVCPSRVDTLSRATVESLVIGTPVVVTENVGARHFVEEYGAGAVTPCNPEMLAQGVERVIADPRFTEGARNHSAVLAYEHSPERAVEIVEKVFLSLG